jgi:hypothetical protein
MLNGRSQIDPRWQTHHGPVVAGFMLASVKFIRKQPNFVRSYDQATSTWNTTGFTTVWQGPARIQPYGIIGDQIVAQDTTGRRLMRVQIEAMDSGVMLDDMGIILDGGLDPELTKFTLEVRGTINSSNPWVTDIVCEADLKGV